jgi:hypothetical protein
MKNGVWAAYTKKMFPLRKNSPVVVRIEQFKVRASYKGFYKLKNDNVAILRDKRDIFLTKEQCIKSLVKSRVKSRTSK